MTDAPTPADIAVGLVMDESGSMLGTTNETISGFNGYLEDLQKEPVEVLLTLTMFSAMGTVEATHRPYCTNKNVKDVKPLDTSTYRPRGYTPLYDAIGATIRDLEQQADHGDKVKIVVILTDGLENASKEFNRGDIFDLIKKKEEEGWKFLYLGADQSQMQAETASGAMGMSASSTVSYGKADTHKVYGSLGATTSLASTSPKASSEDLAKKLKDEQEKK